ncbi:hypothetical protein PVK06_046401 [Gossypium arboreum]|uniref:RNase H type-1 domain-containing protein n=1 Tax=Gossypium arboreum TaxID=29729 RepID=A0ABR0MAE0_GOSAR|nr:hypothetical protein PVK06_046401 [Gossypium arboreum]
MDGVAYNDGLVRNHDGYCRVGFTRNIWICSIVEADIWGAYDGLLLAWELSSSRVILEMDSSDVVTMLKRLLDASSNSATVRDVGRLLRRSWEVQIVHAYGEGNQAPDALANYAFKCPLIIFDLAILYSPYYNKISKYKDNVNTMSSLDNLNLKIQGEMFSLG